MGPIRLVGLAMGSGVAFGLAVVSTTVFVVDVLRPATPSQTIEFGAPFYLLIFGTIGGLLLAGVVAWQLLSPILSIYRRGGLSVVTGLATVLPMLVSMFVNQLAGRAGLAGLGVVAALVSLLLARLARAAEAA